uniref:Small ribosomal subunit protein uS15 N-terminal domain-containing protein n=1 Tax=Panthera leo TaxID=9689 RepID=A0A8C8WVX2_PANLE
MGRTHAPGKDQSQSALPYCRSVPTWLKLMSDDVKEHIYKLAKKGLSPSQIECCITITTICIPNFFDLSCKNSTH